MKEPAPEKAPGKIERLKFASIIFDFDSTVASVESLDELAVLALRDNPKKDEIVQAIKDLTNKGMSGEITFDVSLTERMKLMSPTREQVTEAGIYVAGLLSESFLSNRDFFIKNSEKIYIISGGFEEMILPAAEKLGILAKNIHANRFIFDESGKVVGVDQTRLTSQHLGKVNKVKSLDLPRPIVIIGDGKTDAQIKEMGEADCFISYTEHADRATAVISADFNAKTFEDILRYVQ